MKSILLWKTVLVPFWAMFGKFGLLFIPTSGHTVHHVGRRQLLSSVGLVTLAVDEIMIVILALRLVIIIAMGRAE